MLMFILLAAGLSFFELRVLKREAWPARAFVLYALLLVLALATATAFFLSPSFSLTGWLPPLNPPGPAFSST